MDFSYHFSSEYAILSVFRGGLARFCLEAVHNGMVQMALWLLDK